MDDLISRAAAIHIAEKYGCNNGSTIGRHSGVADCIASEIDGLPAVNAIPIEWLRKLQSELDGPWDTTMNAIDNIIRWWQKEQVNSNG